MNDDTEIVITNENGRKVINPEIMSQLRNIKDEKETLSSIESTLRGDILTAMQANSIEKCSIDGVTVSQVFPRPKTHFDEEAFIQNESDDVVSAFIEIEENESIDLEKLEKEYPEVFAKCLKTEYTTTVDTKRLNKTLPNIFNKYYSEEESDKPSTLRVVIKEEK